MSNKYFPFQFYATLIVANKQDQSLTNKCIMAEGKGETVSTPEAVNSKPFRFMHFCITGVSEYNEAIGKHSTLLVCS